MSAENNLQVVGSHFVVTSQDVEALKRQRDLLMHYVRSQLKEADFSDSRSASYGEGDYGIIPGTKKRCLFKPGAEKLNTLFGYYASFDQIDKELDRAGNFAMYSFKCIIRDKRTQSVVAECIGSCNSQEKKYKERTAWTKNKAGVREATTEETPVCDVLNTLQKMAQKRALIGATLLAVGGSEYFTQDILEPEDLKADAPPSDAKPEAKDVQAEVVSGEPPMCCGKKMMISKYVDQNMGHAPWFCLTCKNKLARE